jgi:gas vesicle protein
MMMTLILGDSDILQACATCLAGVLIFLTIERKLDIVAIENKIVSLKRNIDNEWKAVGQLEKDKLKPKSSESSEHLDSQITESRERLKALKMEVQEELQNRHLGHLQYRIKNREDAVTFLTLLFLTSCIIILIFAENQWIYYSTVSRLLFTLGMIFLLIRVVYRAIDLPGGIKQYLKELREGKNESNG